MTEATSSQSLHDRLSRGIALSAAEQEKLSAWYAAQDRAEAGLLGVATAPGDLPALQIQVRAVMEHLLSVVQDIQELTTQNEMLRQDIAVLKQQLAQKLAPEAA